MGLPLSATTTGSGAAPPAASGYPAPATSAPEGSEDPAVAVSFAPGWQMADLYRDPHHKRPDPSPPPDDLPGISGLTESRRTDLGIRQIEAGLHRLSDRTSAAGLLAPSTKSLRQAFESESDE